MLISAIIIVLTLLFDQITKYIASTNLPLNGANVTWIPGLFEVSYHQNPGMSFGALEGQQFLFMVATIIALGIFGYLFLSTDYKTKKVYSISIALFIAGRLGNAIDRALYGYVIDFIDVYYGAWHWPAFNVADSAITVGAILLVLDALGWNPWGKHRAS